MKRLVLAAALLAVAASAQAQERPDARAQRLGNSYANPSAVIAAELSFAQLAQDKGQWTAFAETAASDAVMFTPKMVYAQRWLKGRANPPVAIKWQPHAVWSSCDGSLMVSHGAWQGPKQSGYFTTLWQRQPKGGYKWILDSTDTVTEPLAAPEMLAARVADCPQRSKRPPSSSKQAKAKALPALNPAKRSGTSNDGTLSWEVTVDPSGARNLAVDWTKDGAVTPVLIEEVAAPE